MDIADFVSVFFLLLIPLASIISAGSASDILVGLTPDVATIIIIVLVVVLGFLLPLIPLLISLFVLNITARLFIFSGKGTPTLWVSLKIIFAGAMVLLVLSALDFVREIAKTKNKKYVR